MANLNIAVIGCGNPNRGDDGVGPAVIERLRTQELPDSVVLHDAGTDGMGVMYQARDATHLILVDARVPGDTPGAVFQVPGNTLAAEPLASFNLHDFRWDHALYAGYKIYGDAFPGEVQVFLVEAESLALGIGLSERVAAAADKVAASIVQLTRTYADTALA